MSYEPYNPLIAPLADRIAWALCQIIDDDAPMRWTRYRFVADCIATNDVLIAELQVLRDQKRNAQRVTSEMRAVLLKGLATGKIVPRDEVRPQDRIATQRSTVLAVLVDLSIVGVGHDHIERFTDRLVAEMTSGPTAWAFKPA